MHNDNHFELSCYTSLSVLFLYLSNIPFWNVLFVVPLFCFVQNMVYYFHVCTIWTMPYIK